MHHKNCQRLKDGVKGSCYQQGQCQDTNSLSTFAKVIKYASDATRFYLEYWDEVAKDDCGTGLGQGQRDLDFWNLPDVMLEQSVQCSHSIY